MISQVLLTCEQPKKNKKAFVRILSQIKLLFGPLVIQLVWYILKQFFSSVSVKWWIFTPTSNSVKLRNANLSNCIFKVTSRSYFCFVTVSRSGAIGN